MAAPVIVWLRRNLRLADNPALLDAAESGHPVLSVYVRDGNRVGAASDRASDRPETRSLQLAGLAVARGRTRRVAQGGGGSASEAADPALHGAGRHRQHTPSSDILSFSLPLNLQKNL